MYKILIVEDDSIIAGTLKNHLCQWGFEVRCIEDFKNVLEETADFTPHLILLDIILPFFNGFHWCQRIREFSKVPIIFLSSASDNMNIVMAMNMGGDDFIEKPFDLNVLTAKIQALLRRSYSFQGNVNVIEHQGLLLNLSDATVLYEGEKIDLTKNEYRILQCLMERAGKIVSREDIITKLWEDDSFIDDNTLTVNMTRLRKKLDKAGLSDLILTKKGIGYLLRSETTMLKGYMRDRAAMFGCLLICYGTLFLIGYLYDIPFEKTRYIAEFSGAGVFLCLLVDILKYAERWKELKRCIATSDTYPGMFYTVPGDLEALYRSMIAKMRQEKEELIFEDQKRYTEMMDYYGMWAHQIKTPIAAMRILVQSGMDREENEENQKLFRQLQMELFKTEQYVEMVLSYLKIGDIAKDMVLERCDLGKVVRQAVKKYSRLFILQKLSLEMGEIAEIVLTDEKWLSFVVEQILSNALKYTKSGSVSIYLEQEGVLVIKDTGIGISVEDLPRIMEKGYTGYNGRIDKRSTGIGLYLCKKVMDKLHHQLRIDSEDGKGTKVVLDLRRTQLDLE